MFKYIQIVNLIFLFGIGLIDSELKCNFKEFHDASSIYTCELVSSAAIIENGHMSGKTDADVQSFKFDGFKTNELFDVKLPFCKNYKNLEIVKLFSAGIADLNQNLFFDCENLKFLSLASNKISQVPENLFTRNLKLTTLSLEQNELPSLPENVFANLNELSDLNLSKNKIKTLPVNIFTSLVKLRVLKLNSNRIQNVVHNWFRNLQMLEDLDLSNNLISNLGQKNFQFLTNLIFLQLNNNNIKELSANVFYNLFKLEELNLDFNEISSPFAEAFKDLKNLKKLSIGANGIIDLPEKIFSTLSNLDELKLWQNQLSTIHSDSFGTYNNQILIDLEDNNIYAIDPSLIGYLDSLRLYMDGNVCYQGDLENKSEMFQELNECVENYEPRQGGVETSTFGSTSKPNTITYTFNTKTDYLTFPRTTTIREATSTETTSTFKPITTRKIRTTTTRILTTTRKVKTTTKLLPRPPQPYPVTTHKPTTTTTSLWNLLEPENIPTCGRSKLKLSGESSGSQVRHGAYPWTAALIRRDGQLFCGGILVSKSLVVTAAHCIEGKQRLYVFNNQDFFVMLGAHNIKQSFEKGRTTVNVKAIHVHDDWNPSIDQYDADIAIIELEADVILNRFIQPICIPEAGSIPATKNQGFVVGFGKSEFADIQDVARLVHTPIHDNRKCHSSHDAFQLLLSHRGFCGGYANGTGVCTGDSGSGLIVVHNGVFYLRGIVSASLNGPLNGCNLNAFTVFTDLLEFTGWIKIGKDDKTLIQYLIDRIRKCEANKGTTERMTQSSQQKQTNGDAWRVRYPND
ncbi:hypothetical protein ACKWTF_016409 [Chironomus riparius]